MLRRQLLVVRNTKCFGLGLLFVIPLVFELFHVSVEKHHLAILLCQFQHLCFAQLLFNNTTILFYYFVVVWGLVA